MTRIVSWNVNGLRAALRKGFLDFVAAENPDILCLQEVRATPDQVAIDLPGYAAHWHPARRKGYAGTAVFTKTAPLAVDRGLGERAPDTEGRVLTLDYPRFALVTVYTPNVGRTLARLAYRARTWDPAFRAHVCELAARKPVVFCGDLNVAHQEIDLADPDGNRGNAGFTDEERAGFDALLAEGFLDTFRQFTTQGGHYTWWSYWGKARSANHGWRIDYVCVSPQLRAGLARADILGDVTGSDHAPVAVTLD